MRAHQDFKTIGIMFGGRSIEHEISIITALQAIEALDSLKYHIVPIYIHPTGRWYTGEALLDRSFYKKMPSALSQLRPVTLLPDPTIGGLLYLDAQSDPLDARSTIPIDVYLLFFHGQHGEDGCLQGLLEMANVAYTGSNVSSSALAMNKFLCKQFLQSHGIPVLPSLIVRREKAPQSLADVKALISAENTPHRFPLFVKPCHLGSSVGIGMAHTLEELHTALATVFRYDSEALIEPCITQLMEINIAVLDGNPPRASVLELPVASEKMLTYEDKYMRGGGKKSAPASGGMASLTRVIDPQNLDPTLKNAVIEHALHAFRLLGCSGTGRFDFMVDLATHALYFNELNPLPGSLAYYLWEKSHPPLLYTELLDQLISHAEQRQHQKLALQHDMGFKAL